MLYFSKSAALQLAVALAAALVGATVGAGGVATSGAPLSLSSPASHQSVALLAHQPGDGTARPRNAAGLA